MSTGAYLRDMWGRRSFAMAMPMEQVRSTHQDTLLGNIWHLANPLLSVAVYSLVFGVFLNVSRDIDNYLLWLTVGVFAYGLTSRSIQNGATSIPTNQGPMRSMRFPRALLPVSSAFADLITFGFQLIVLGVVAVVTETGSPSDCGRRSAVEHLAHTYRHPSTSSTTSACRLPAR